MKMIECPCCEGVSNYDEWYEISNDGFALCPRCENTCTYDEFVNGEFE